MKKPDCQMEWDHQAYYRKFNQTLAYAKVGNQEAKWHWIGAISDSNFIYGDPRRPPIGQYLCQSDKGHVHHDPDDYPIVQFFYQPIFSGAYRSKACEDQFYFLQKRHMKSYRIGCSDETFNVISCLPDVFLFDRVRVDIDLSRPVTIPFLGGKCEVFSQHLVKIGTTLYTNGDSIGFMENGVCMVRNKNFVPLLKPLLEDKWQIES